MTVALRKGWCPGALRPMMAKDGLLVRLRITGGILPAPGAYALAGLSARYGNGQIDLSARGKLQLRGVSAGALAALQRDLLALGLLDDDAAAEAVRNVIASPLAGLTSDIDIRPITRALERRLASDTSLHALPQKFGFLIDDGGAPTLRGIDADVRFERSGAHFAIGLGGRHDEATWIGTCEPSEIVDTAARIARAAIALFATHPESRRMRSLISALGPSQVAQACGGAVAARPAITEIAAPADIVGARSFCGQDFTGFAAPFGRLDAGGLRALADLAAATPRGELRLTPWRVILVPDAPAGSTIPGLVTDPADPRLGIAACAGADGCERGTTQTHRDAAHLAAALPRGRGIALHVSGCEKGCAKPSRTAFTIIGQAGRYDLVRDGRAGDAPERRGLDLAAVRRVLESASAGR